MSISFQGGMRTGGANGFTNWANELKDDLSDLKGMKAELAEIQAQIPNAPEGSSKRTKLEARARELGGLISGKENELAVDAYEIALERGDLATARNLFQKFTPEQKATATPMPSSASYVNNYQNN
jgi:hypothetical protein